MRYLLILFLLLSGCAATEKNQTQSGAATRFFPDHTVGQVKEAIVGACAQSGSVISDVSAYSVTCAREMDSSFGSILYRALATERYASNPEVTVLFAVYKSGGGSAVTARAWIEHENAFGKTTKNYLTSAKNREALMKDLDALKLGEPQSEARDDHAAGYQAAPANAASPVVGDYAYSAEQFSLKNNCVIEKKVNDIQNLEIYSSLCENGQPMLIRCEWGNCAHMQ